MLGLRKFCNSIFQLMEKGCRFQARGEQFLCFSQPPIVGLQFALIKYRLIPMFRVKIVVDIDMTNEIVKLTVGDLPRKYSLQTDILEKIYYL